MNEILRAELLAMTAEALTVRRRLIDAGRYSEDSPAGDEVPTELARIHRRNAARLYELLVEFGWPGRRLAGDDGCEAAWIIARNASHDPSLQALCEKLLQIAVANGDAPAWQYASLVDNVRKQRGELQLYGTITIKDETGALKRYPIADPDRVNTRRRALGLPPLKGRPVRVRPEEEETREQPRATSDPSSANAGVD